MQKYKIISEIKQFPPKYLILSPFAMSMLWYPQLLLDL